MTSDEKIFENAKKLHLNGQIKVAQEIYLKLFNKNEDNVDLNISVPVKDVFKTFKEINQLELIVQAGIRQQYVDQAVSLNLAFPKEATPKWINKCHMEAWKRGIKTLYYMRTESVLRGDIASQAMNEDCLSCDG